MDVRCERCKTQYELDDSRISETGVTVQCTNCHHVFVVKKKALVVTVPVKPSQVPPGAQVGTPEAPSSAPPPALRPLSSPIEMAPPVAAAPQAAAPEQSPPPEAPAPSLPPATALPGSREWKIRQAVGNVFTLKDLTTLQKWIVERKVSRDDEISLTGDTWKRIGDIAELATFFQLVDEAQKAAVLQAQVNLGLTPASAAPPSPAPSAAPPLPQPPSPEPPASAPPPPQPVPAPPRASRLPLILLVLVVLLGGGGAGYYFLVEVPRQEEEARREAAAKLEQERQVWERQEQERLARERQEQERQEKERQAQLLAAQAAEAQLRADAGGLPGPSDGGALGVPGALEAGDGGTPGDAGWDAGSPDAGSHADAGTDHDGGAPAVKKPAPVRDFDYYMSQGNRLRERERGEAALDAYAQAAELEPNRPEPYSGRGLALLDMGSPRQAEAEFKQALKIDANFGEAIMGLAETYRSQGKKAEAIRYYERYLEILPNGPESSVARSAIEYLKE